MISELLREKLRDKAIYSAPANGAVTNLVVCVGNELIGPVLPFKKCEAVVEWLRLVQFKQPYIPEEDEY